MCQCLFVCMHRLQCMYAVCNIMIGSVQFGSIEGSMYTHLVCVSVFMYRFPRMQVYFCQFTSVELHFV